MDRNYYNILGVSKKASYDEIKSSYRKLAMQCHPDKNPDNTAAAEKFMMISKAYETLSNPVKRKQYDSESSGPQTQKKPSPTPFQAPTGKNPFDLASALHVFMQNVRGESSFHNSSEERTTKNLSSQGSNIQITVGLTLSEILHGCKKTIRVSHAKKCINCSGSGSLAGKLSLVTCGQCAGKGLVRVVGQEGTLSCTICEGSGYIPENACTFCGGKGRFQGETDIAVQFPKGITEGNYITLAGMGEAGIRGGSPGDVLLFIEDRANDTFIRRGYDLETDISISMVDAVLGGSFEINDLEGTTHRVAVKPGTQPESLYCIAQRGLPQYKQDNRGDLYVRVHVTVPHELSEDALTSFNNFAAVLKAEDNQDSTKQCGKYYIITLNPDERSTNFNSSFDKAEILTESKVPLALHLGLLEYIDSVGLGMMMKIHKRLAPYGESLVLIGACEAILEILQDCSLDMIFTLVDSENALQESEGNNAAVAENKDELKDGSYAVKEVGGHTLYYAGSNECPTKILEDNNADTLLDQPGSSIGIDLHDVKTVNSLTLGSWVRYYNRAQKSGSDFFLLAPNTIVQNVLATTNLQSLFKIIEKESQLQSLHG